MVQELDYDGAKIMVHFSESSGEFIILDGSRPSIEILFVADHNTTNQSKTEAVRARQSDDLPPDRHSPQQTPIPHILIISLNYINNKLLDRT